MTPTHCPRCGYDLSHLASDRCPECGLRVTDERELRGWAVPWEGDGGVVRRFVGTTLRCLRPGRLAEAAALSPDRARAVRFRRVAAGLTFVLALPLAWRLRAAFRPVIENGRVAFGKPSWSFDEAMPWWVDFTACWGAGAWEVWVWVLALGWWVALLAGVPAAVAANLPLINPDARGWTVAVATYLAGLLPVLMLLVGVGTLVPILYEATQTPPPDRLYFSGVMGLPTVVEPIELPGWVLWCEAVPLMLLASVWPLACGWLVARTASNGALAGVLAALLAVVHVALATLAAFVGLVWVAGVLRVMLASL